MASILPRMSFRALSSVSRMTPLSRASLAPELLRPQPLAQPLVRRSLATIPQEQPRLRLGSTGKLIDQEQL